MKKLIFTKNNFFIIILDHICKATYLMSRFDINDNYIILIIRIMKVKPFHGELVTTPSFFLMIYFKCIYIYIYIYNS